MHYYSPNRWLVRPNFCGKVNGNLNMYVDTKYI